MVTVDLGTTAECGLELLGTSTAAAGPWLLGVVCADLGCWLNEPVLVVSGGGPVVVGTCGQVERVRRRKRRDIERCLDLGCGSRLAGLGETGENGSDTIRSLAPGWTGLERGTGTGDWKTDSSGPQQGRALRSRLAV